MDFPILLDPASAQPLHRQVYLEIRGAILSGRLAPGQRLPSTRALADHLEISRTTATQGCAQLVSEGYLETVLGSGTFVCKRLPDDFPALPTLASVAGEPAESGLSEFGRHLEALEPPGPDPATSCWDFSPGRPALEAFPIRLWNRLLSRQCREGAPEVLDYTPEIAGLLRLREAVAEYLRRSRAVRCDADQVIIVNGSQQGIDLATRVLVDPGQPVAMEDPGYLGARRSFAAHGARILPLPLREGGLDLAALEEARPRIVYVTPSHQYPTGAVLSLAERLQLLSWARDRGSLILEDDYDSEFRFEGRPLPAMQGLDGTGTVLYSGTFSKVLFPSLRLGYLVAPPRLAPVLAKAQWLTCRQTPSLDQAVLADFIQEGHLERHIRRMRTLYAARREAMAGALATHFGPRAEILGGKGGMHLMVRFRDAPRDADLMLRAAKAGVILTPAGGFYLTPRDSAGFVMGFSGMPPERIREGIRRLAEVV